MFEDKKMFWMDLSIKVFTAVSKAKLIRLRMKMPDKLFAHLFFKDVFFLWFLRFRFNLNEADHPQDQYLWEEEGEATAASFSSTKSLDKEY